MTLDDPDLARLRDVLDSSFGAGPPLPPPAERLAEGRRALRRRRSTGVVGGAVVAVVLAASFALVGGGGTAPRGADPAAPAPDVATPQAGDLDEAELEAELDEVAALAQVRARHARSQRLVSDQFPAALDQDGTLVVKDGWEVTQRVPEPVGYQPPEASLGVVVTDGRRTRWMLLTVNRALDERGVPIDGELSASASADDAGKGYARFEDWLASMVALNGGQQPPPLVTVSGDDQVRPGPGSTLVEVQEIEVIEGYTSPGDRVAELRRDGRTWFAVIRGHGRDADVIPVDGEVLPHATLAALLVYVGQQMESGEGLR